MAFLDGEVSVSETQTIAAHIEHCADCSAIATQFRSTSKSLSDWKVEAVPTEFEHPVANLAARTLTGQKDSDAGKFAHVGSWHWNGWAIGAGVIAGVLLLVAVTSPNLLRSRMVANEASAVGSLRALITALAGYSSAYGHFPPSLVNFGPPSDGRVNESAADLIDSPLASGRKSGYMFSYHRVPADSLSRKAGYTINGNPTDPRKTGSRAFFTDQTGVIRIVGGGILDSPSESQPFGRGLVLNRESPQSFTESGLLIARTVELSLIVQAISETRSRLDQVLKQHKGYIGNLSASAEDGSARTLDASLRVPADQLDTSVDDLRKLGRVTHESQAGQEVTQQHIYLAARLKNSRNTETRLSDILHKSNGQQRIFSRSNENPRGSAAKLNSWKRKGKNWNTASSSGRSIFELLRNTKPR